MDYYQHFKNEGAFGFPLYRFIEINVVMVWVTGLDNFLDL
jgi:hypothetical protein